MSTPALVARAETGGGFSGVYVRGDGYPEGLGTTLLNFIEDVGGDLERVWSTIARAPEGWRSAFSEPYDEGENRDYFATGRDEGFLRESDPFVREQVAYWYILDVPSRTLTVHSYVNRSWTVTARASFVDAIASFEGPLDGPLDWRNRRRSRGTDDARATAAAIVELLRSRLPVKSRTLLVNALDAENGGRAELTEAGLVFPMIMFVSAPDPAQVDRVQITDIIEHPAHLLVPRRALSERARCGLAASAAIDALSESAAREGRLAFPSPYTFGRLFPFDLLDLELDADALRAAIRTRVTECFERQVS
jgi:hypothetical protein